MKGGSPYYTDQRPMREESVPGKAVIARVVTPEGLVIEPRILQSTDQRVANYMINLITPRRFAPARVQGAAVFSLWTDEFVWLPGKVLAGMLGTCTREARRWNVDRSSAITG